MPLFIPAVCITHYTLEPSVLRGGGRPCGHERSCLRPQPSVLNYSPTMLWQKLILLMNSGWKISLVHSDKLLVLLLKLKIGWSCPNSVDVKWAVGFCHRSKLVSHSAAVLNLTINAVTCITTMVWDLGSFVRAGLRIVQTNGVDKWLDILVFSDKDHKP